MMADCRRGLIGQILVKSISRFARNTKDCLEAVRELKELGVNVRFEREGIDTANVSSELITAIYAAFAQKESESISGNMRWSYQRRMEAGTFLPSSMAYGYKLVDRKIEIDADAALVVCRIFQWYLNGVNRIAIAKMLNEEGISSGQRKKWHSASVRYILTNEKYTGDSLWQKTYTSDTLPATRHKNTGEHEQYYAVGTHPPIIPRKTFDQVQTLMQKRSVGQAVTHGRLCVRMRCSCGSRIRAKQVNGRWYWCCCRHDEKGDCAIKPVPERRRMKPSAASTISSSIRASPFWSRCSRPSGRSVIADCSGARTSFPSTKKYPNSPVRIERWPSSSKTASLILTFLYPKATS